MTTDKMMQMFKLMEENGIFLSIDLEEGTSQVGEKEIIGECPDLK